MYTLKFRGDKGWTERSNVVFECILKCNVFLQTDVRQQML